MEADNWSMGENFRRRLTVAIVAAGLAVVLGSTHFCAYDLGRRHILEKLEQTLQFLDQHLEYRRDLQVPPDEARDLGYYKFTSPGGRQPVNPHLTLGLLPTDLSTPELRSFSWTHQYAR